MTTLPSEPSSRPSVSACAAPKGRKSAVGIVLAIIGILCIAYGLAIMFVWSGTYFFAVWYLLGALFLIAAWLTMSGIWAGVAPVIKYGVRIVCGVFVVALIVSGGFIFSAFTAQGEDDLDYLVVLGAQVKPEGPSVILQYRLDTAYDYLMENPCTLCIVSGGQGPSEPTTEASGMAAYLMARGIPESRIIIEDESANTVQNIVNSKTLLDDPSSRVGIVTSNFHVFRGVRIAQRYGIEHTCGIAAPSHAFYLPNNLLRECLSIIKDAAMGNL